MWLLLITQVAIAADLQANTEDGRPVILHEDGTWEFSAAPAPTSPTESAAEGAFRDIPWGSSRSVVTAKHGTPALSESDYIVYEMQVAGFPVATGFVFAEDQLVRGKYVFMQQHTNGTDFIQDYAKILQILSDKYGPPAEDQTVWKDDLYRDKPSDWGMALKTGDLVKYSTWTTPTESISLLLSGDNFKINLIAEYESSKHQELIDRATKAANAAGL